MEAVDAGLDLGAAIGLLMSECLFLLFLSPLACLLSFLSFRWSTVQWISLRSELHVACVVSSVDDDVCGIQGMGMKAESEAKGVIRSRKQRERDCKRGAAEVD